MLLLVLWDGLAAIHWRVRPSRNGMPFLKAACFCAYSEEGHYRTSLATLVCAKSLSEGLGHHVLRKMAGIYRATPNRTSRATRVVPPPLCCDVTHNTAVGHRDTVRIVSPTCTPFPPIIHTLGLKHTIRGFKNNIIHLVYTKHYY